MSIVLEIFDEGVNKTVYCVGDTVEKLERLPNSDKYNISSNSKG